MSNIALPANVTKSIAMISLLDLFALYIGQNYQAIVFGKKKKICTVQAYENKRKLLSQYLAYSNQLDIKPPEFTSKHLCSYFDHLIRKGYKHNYAARCVEIIKNDVIKFGVASGVVPFNPLSEITIQKQRPGEPKPITLDELSRIEKYKPTCSTLEKARDMFLYQCWSGMDYGDTATVSHSNLIIHGGKEYIKKMRAKTGFLAVIPLSAKCAELMSKHNYCMRLLSNAKYNKALKTLARELEIRTYLTTHVGRKTFAMHKLNHEGFSVQAVSRMLGHSSIKTTEEVYVIVELELVHREFCKLKKSA